MVKLPVAGTVKTRLARTIGAAEALRFYRSTSRAVIRRLAAEPHWETILAVAPDTAVGSRVWPHSVSRMPQGRGDIGVRMQRPMRWLPPGPVCVVGTDVPGIDAGAVRAAFRQLGRADMVFGPATDGGFWLVGARRRPRVIEPYFGVRWSSAETLADALGNLHACEVCFTATLNDIDEAADLELERAATGRLIRPRHPRSPPPA